MISFNKIIELLKKISTILRSCGESNWLPAIENFISKDPDVIKATKEYFIEQNKVIKENNIYQAFYPLQTSVNFEHGKFSVTGILRRNTGNVFVSEERKVMDFDFIVKNGQLVIKKFGVK